MTSATLHISREGTTIGQFPLDTAQQCLDSGIILPSDLCWHEGMSEWKPVSEVLNATVPPATAPPPILESPPLPTQATINPQQPSATGAVEKKRSVSNYAIAGGVLLSCLVCCLIGQFMPDMDTSSSSSPTNSPEPVVEKKWFEGGTLHDATIAEWNKATYDNQLATTADWLSLSSWKGHLNSPRDFDRLKIKANMLVMAVTEAGEPAPYMKAKEIAAMTMVLANDLGPD